MLESQRIILNIKHVLQTPSNQLFYQPAPHKEKNEFFSYHVKTNSYNQAQEYGHSVSLLLHRYKQQGDHSVHRQDRISQENHKQSASSQTKKDKKNEKTKFSNS